MNLLTRMNEQPQQPEIPEQQEDLFEWAQTQPQPKKEEPPKFVYASKEDGLGWDCKYCDDNGGYCPRHPLEESVKNEADFERDSSMKIVEHEEKIAEVQRELEKLPTPEELDEFFEETKKRIAS